VRPPAPKRNLGWRTARAPIVAFTDDDCEPQPNWLSAGLAGFADDVVIVQGRTCPHPDDDGNRGTFARTLDVGRLNETYPTANLFYRRDAVERVNGFDERFGAAAGEDTDLAWRVLELGGRTVFADHALVFHAVHPFGFVDHLRSLPRWADLALVARRHPEARRLVYRRWFWKKTHTTAVLAAVGLLAAPFDKRAAFLALPHLVRRVRSDGPVVGPQLAMVDLAEVAVMVRGSIRHRAVLI
jgi:GT2 family glycosyltransferase